MIYLTGDFHGDKKRFRTKAVRRLKKGDTLIICGDFGFIWDGSKHEKQLLDRIGKLKYNVLFVEGEHDNLTLLGEYPVEQWNGGLTHAISGKLRHLIRGERFEIDNATVLALGGGCLSGDMYGENAPLRGTMPSNEEITDICSRMQEYDWTVDIIASHQAPTNIDACITHRLCDVSMLTALLDTVQQKTKFSTWCFGSYHQNKPIPPVYHALYDEVYCACGGKK